MFIPLQSTRAARRFAPHSVHYLRLWPGVAEELVGTKAYYVRDGMFKDVMERFRPQMQKMYYDASKFDTYLEQLGIKYPTVR